MKQLGAISRVKNGERASCGGVIGWEFGVFDLLSTRLADFDDASKSKDCPRMMINYA
jgi:hypothetical protein